MSRYVSTGRGPRLDLAPHPEACDLDRVRLYAKNVRRPLAVDLFCGAGGLSLGLELAGYQVILGVDRDPHAIRTHRAHFGGASYQADLSDPREIARICTALEGLDIEILAGGPPCQPFSRAGRGKIRSLIDAGHRDARDERRELGRAFIDVVTRVAPRAVLIENVPDMAMGRDIRVVQALISGLEDLGYAVTLRVLQAADFGVPQDRQRLFIVGFRERVAYRWPSPSTRLPRVLRDAISDLPPVAGGWNTGELDYEGPRTAYQRWLRTGLTGDERFKIQDHMTRAVRPDDLEAFARMDHETRYSDLPDYLRRYRSDIFDDKYRRLQWDELCPTITAHIARDGYWYIHPDQHRTLTVREAARVQSFPDRFRFAGAPSHAFRQIGEAVPPLLGRALGRSILRALRFPLRERARPSPRDYTDALTAWIRARGDDELIAPWYRSGNLWHILLGMLLFERQKRSVVLDFWPTYRSRWPDGRSFLQDPFREAALKAIGRPGVISQLNAVAQALTQGHGKSSPGRIRGVSAQRLDLAHALSGSGGKVTPTPAMLRVVERVFSERVGRSRLVAQLLLARLVEVDSGPDAYAALLEIGHAFCRQARTECSCCPLQSLCNHGRKRVKPFV